MDIELQLQNKMNLSPQFRQSIEILQMTGLELAEYVEKLTEENPVIELDETAETVDKNEQIIKKLQWLDSVDEHNYRSLVSDRDEERPEMKVPEDSSEYDICLKKSLYDQLASSHFEKEIQRIIEYVIECLDENGYLTERPENIAGELKTTISLVDKAISIVRSLDPAGVGAYNLQECLLLQLDRKNAADGIAACIVKDYLVLLGKNQLSVIARELKVSIEDVKEAVEIIKSLNPKPGNGFKSLKNTDYIAPDIIVVRFKDKYDILLNDYFIPKIRLSSYYRTVLKSTENKQTYKYLADKFKSAEWAVKCIDQRKSTLLNCAQEIVVRQRDFFDQGPCHLKPLTISEIADSIGLHVSTISRAIKGKYLLCLWGTFSLSDFFPRELNFSSESSDTSNTMKNFISEIIVGEDKKNPLSDQQITLLLHEKGIGISRRTVTKYRDEMGIPGTCGRREF